MNVELIEIGADTPGQSNVLRVLTFEGSGNGPAVYMQAGLHAQEIPGLIALDQLLPKLQRAEKDGRLASTITVVPHANPIGLSQCVYGANLGRFDMNSRVNFNRSFPKPQQSPTNLENTSVVETLKARLLSLALKADIVLDLHCDDEGPVYIYAPEPLLEGARVLSAALEAVSILTYIAGSGSSFEETVYLHWCDEAKGGIPVGKFVSTVEFRGMMDVSQSFGEVDAANLYGYLVAIGAIRDDPPRFKSNDPLVSDEALAELIPTPVSGAVLYCVDVCELVSAGQCVARIVGEAGTPHHEILAPADGFVMTRRERRYLRKGEDVLKILRHGQKNK
jgi:predicted deacylase